MPGVEITWEEMLDNDGFFEEDDRDDDEWKLTREHVTKAEVESLDELFALELTEELLLRFEDDDDDRYLAERNLLREALENMLDAAEACGNGEPDCPARYHQATKAARAALEALTGAA